MSFVLPCLLFLAHLAIGANITMPDFTGPYKVGTTVIEIVDHSRLDPRAPTLQPRDLIVSLFYPLAKHSEYGTASYNCTPAVQIPTRSAMYLESREPIKSGSLQNVLTHACLDAPLSNPSLPLLLFSPGHSSSRYLHSYTLGELASYGWNVVSIDHPYEVSVVEYPDGRIAYEIPFNGTEEEELRRTIENVDIRTADLIAVLDALDNSTITDQIPGFASSKFRTDRVAVLGHSLGGATALRVTANDTRFAVGVNMDGYFWGTESQIGTDAPFMVLAGENSTRETFGGWAETWENLRNLKREYNVQGSSHLAFTDIPVYRDLVPDFSPIYDVAIGPINGTRSIGIQRSFVNSLFQKYLKGVDDGLLDGKGLENWPEVTNVE